MVTSLDGIFLFALVALGAGILHAVLLAAGGARGRERIGREGNPPRPSLQVPKGIDPLFALERRAAQEFRVGDLVEIDYSILDDARFWFYLQIRRGTLQRPLLPQGTLGIVIGVELGDGDLLQPQLLVSVEGIPTARWSPLMWNTVCRSQHV